MSHMGVSISEFKINSDDFVIARQQKEIPRHDFLNNLSQAEIYPKLYFSHRDASYEYAGYSALIESDKIPQITFKKSQQGNAFDLPFFGGTSFDHLDEKSHPFKGFKKEFFFLPKILVVQAENQCIQYSFAIYKKDEKTQFDDFEISNMQVEPVSFETVSISHFPKLNDWNRDVSSLISQMKHKELEKVVMARRTQIAVNRPINSFLALKNLKDGFENSSYFCFELEKGLSFLGATPECLYSRLNRHLSTEAIAGTTLSKSSKNLLKSQKEIDEFSYVADFFNQRLTKLSKKTNEGENRIANIGYLHHLYRSFSAELLNDVTDEMLIKELFPSPALCGTPQNLALKKIQELEPFARHWYASPLGYISQNETQLIIAIRSCLISNKEIHLFVGNGIIKDSDSQQEWDELDAKMGPFLNFFNHVSQ